MMKDVHELFEKHKITYWISGGATLGVLRHQGLIPWDIDIDLNILHQDELKFQDLKAEFESLGYYFYQESLLYRISKKDNIFYQEPGFNSSVPFLEVYVMSKEQGTDKYIYAHEPLTKLYPREYYYEDKLFTLKKYTYGSIELWGPKDAEWYVNNYYGSDWNNVARIDSNRNVVLPGNKPLYFNITENLRHPAQPTNPLQDRVNLVK